MIGEVMRAYPEVTAWIVDDPRWETLEGSGSEAEPVAPGTDEAWRKRWRGDPPSLQLVRAQGSHMAGRITECPSLQNALGSKVTVGRAAGDEVLRQLERGRGEETEAMPSVLEVATLTVSPDAKEALVEVGAWIHPGGRVDRLYLRRTPSGEWKTAGSMLMLID